MRDVGESEDAFVEVPRVDGDDDAGPKGDGEVAAPAAGARPYVEGPGCSGCVLAAAAAAVCFCCFCCCCSSLSAASSSPPRAPGRRAPPRASTPPCRFCRPCSSAPWCPRAPRRRGRERRGTSGAESWGRAWSSRRFPSVRRVPPRRRRGRFRSPLLLGGARGATRRRRGRR